MLEGASSNLIDFYSYLQQIHLKQEGKIFIVKYLVNNCSAEMTIFCLFLFDSMQKTTISQQSQLQY